MEIDLKRRMRRSVRQVDNRDWIYDVLDRADVLSLAVSTPDGFPYVFPIRFGRDGDTIYIHSSLRGLKAEIIAVNPRVAFSTWVDVERHPREGSTNKWKQRYRSVCGFGEAIPVTDNAGKIHAVEVIKTHYAESLVDYAIDEKTLEKLLGIYAIRIEHICGRVKGYENPDKPGMKP